MYESTISQKSVLFAILFAMSILIFSFFQEYLDDSTKIVFCDVGQGDAAYIRVKNRTDVLIDAGADRKVLSCLGKYMPFWDKTLEIVFLSHPQKDHYGGFLYILDRYNIESFVLNPVSNDSQTFQALIEKIFSKRVSVYYFFAGDSIKAEDFEIKFFWPQKSFIYQNIDLANRNDLGMYQSNLDPNEFSQIFSFTTRTSSVLFTGDTVPKTEAKLENLPIRKVTILKVPHHGSKNGLTEAFLTQIQPKIAIISVGKNNSYGHPSTEVVHMLQKQAVEVHRTDLEGNIAFSLK